MRGDVTRVVRRELRRRISELRGYHGWLSDWKLQDRTWSIYSTGRVTDSTIHFDLPPRNVRRGYDGYGHHSVPYYYGERNGQEVRVRRQDLEWRGFVPETSDSLVGRPVRRDNHPGHGDETVPAFSGSHLFSQSETVPLGHHSIDWTRHRQFEATGVSHEPAFEDADVQNLTKRWIRYMLSQPTP